MKVIYIAGAGRSGTTLLECMLGQIPGIVAAGEVTHLFRRGWAENQLCGCGRPFHQCEFWPRVMEASFRNSPLSPPELGALRGRICTLPRLPQMAFSRLRTRRFQERLSAYSAGLTRLYRGIAHVSGCDVVVDSSKYCPEAYLLSRMEGIDLVVIHLVRDSASVVASWRRPKVRPEIYWKRELMPRYPAVQTSVAWSVKNWLLERLDGTEGVDYRRVRFEEMIADPRGVVSEVARAVDRGDAELDFIEDGHVRLEATHTVSGNPSRFRTGRIPLIPDSEARRRMPWAIRAAVGLLTLPHRRRYGYPTRVR